MSDERDVYEEIADLCASSLCLGAVPREVIIRKMKERWATPDEARRGFEQLKVEAEKFAAALAYRGQTIAYEIEELERVQDEQRRLT